MESIKVILSKKFSLMGRDYIRGLIMAGLTAALVVVQTSFDVGSLEFKWKQVGMAFIAGGLSYLIKNGLFEPTKIITTTKNISAEVVEEKIKEAV